MSILSTVSTGSHINGLRVVIAGQEKIGKTTLACASPKPLLVPLEVGSNSATVPKVDPASVNSFVKVMNLLTELCTIEQLPYESLIIDSGTELERMIHTYIIENDSSFKSNPDLTIEAAAGGYGKAYTLANDLFSKFLKACDYLAVYKNLNIIITCHSFAARIVDPTCGEFDMWDLLLHSPKNQKTYGKREMLTQWADLVGFMYEPYYIAKGDETSRAISSNKGRVLGLSRTPGYVAGNRFGMDGEISIKIDQPWNCLAHKLYESCGIDKFNRD